MRQPCLFVYGTLRRGFENKYAQLLHAHSRFLSGAKMPGRLIQRNGYTAAVVSDQPGEWVSGELFELVAPKILEELDEYEGSDYERVLVTVLLEDGEDRETWVYLSRRLL